MHKIVEPHYCHQSDQIQNIEIIRFTKIKMTDYTAIDQLPMTPATNGISLAGQTHMTKAKPCIPQK